MIRALRPTRWAGWASLACWAAASLHGSVEIRSVGFRLVDHELSRQRWLEAVVEVDAQRERGEGRFVRDLVVRLAMALETPEGSKPSFEFFDAAIEPVALEAGRSELRFYLPPELVDALRARGEPFAFEAEVWRGNELLSLWVSPRLEREEALASFRERLAEQRPRNAGMLRPQALSPFFDYYPRSTPTARLGGE